MAWRGETLCVAHVLTVGAIRVERLRDAADSVATGKLEPEVPVSCDFERLDGLVEQAVHRIGDEAAEL